MFVVIDQTPTPTKFLRNCEEVGLFNELKNPFEDAFRKATLNFATESRVSVKWIKNHKDKCFEKSMILLNPLLTSLLHLVCFQ